MGQLTKRGIFAPILQQEVRKSLACGEALRIHTFAIVISPRLSLKLHPLLRSSGLPPPIPFFIPNFWCLRNLHVVSPVCPSPWSLPPLPPNPFIHAIVKFKNKKAGQGRPQGMFEISIACLWILWVPFIKTLMKRRSGGRREGGKNLDVVLSRADIPTLHRAEQSSSPVPTNRGKLEISAMANGFWKLEGEKEGTKKEMMNTRWVRRRFLMETTKK
ncbi:hypothetical protein DL95DRAFT_485168 [Leptodontidium sp. 2 PMI_412]|nr:hypothetical protein DL95DRAFT_485168 [Leptodontidium sp. 2 PMI_412]